MVNTDLRFSDAKTLNADARVSDVVFSFVTCCCCRLVQVHVQKEVVFIDFAVSDSCAQQLVDLF